MFDLRGVVEALQALPVACDDEARVDQIRLLEQVKAVAAAVQAQVTAAFVTSQRAEQAAQGVKPELVGRGIASQVGLARRISPHQARRYVGWSMILTSELPHTLAALRAGATSEWRALTVARETLFLPREDRAAVDAELAPQLAGWGDRRVEAETRRAAYRLDPVGSLARARAAAADRRVSLRPAPDCMARLTALLPVAQAVGVYAALTRHADIGIGVGNGQGRSRGQIMADTLVERVTGQATASDVPVEIALIMTDRTLLDGAGEPGQLLGYGPVPAGLARDLALGPRSGAGSTGTPRWIRRLYRHPDSGQLAAMDSTRRLFTPAQRRFLRLRDQSCRTPWCDAPIRHADHVIAHEHGGKTSTGNGEGNCAGCNYAKQAPGYTAHPTGRPGEIELRTPTGHTYRHRPPDPPGSRGRSAARERSRDTS